MKINKNLNEIIILGDSIYRGVLFDNEKNKYSSSSEIYLSELGSRLSINYKNISMFGLTTERVIAKNIHLDCLKEEPKPDIFLVSIGGNDCDFDWNEVGKNPDGDHIPKVKPEQYVNNITQIINDIKSKGVKPLIVSLAPLYIERFFAHIIKNGYKDEILKWLGQTQTLYMWQEYYNNLLEQVAAKLEIQFINIRPYFLKNHKFSELYSEDGIHLSKEGYQFLVDAIENEFRNNPVL